MSRNLLPKIACLCLFAALSTACTNKDREIEVSRAGVGSQSKTGITLSRHRWCRPTTTNGQGHVVIEQFTFNSNGEFALNSYILNTGSTLTLKTSEAGTWAVIDSNLILMHEGRTLNLQYTNTVRESDGANCLNLSTETKTEQICPCTLH